MWLPLLEAELRKPATQHSPVSLALLSVQAIFYEGNPAPGDIPNLGQSPEWEGITVSLSFFFRQC